MDTTEKLIAIAQKQNVSILHLCAVTGNTVILVTPNNIGPVDALFAVAFEILKELEGEKPCQQKKP